MSALVRARRHRYSKATLRLLACAWGFIIFPNVSARAEAPPGSVYVPLDNWAYAAFDRLAALGATNQQFAGLRPWTRVQSAQLVLEAGKRLTRSEGNIPEAMELYNALREEFREEINVLTGDSEGQVGVESFYSRALGISGTPLRNSFDFGQTISNDFGRPYYTGFNNVSGFSGQMVQGRFHAFARGEYQYSPFYPGLTPAQMVYIELSDGTTTTANSQATGTISRFNLLDTYVGMRLGVFDLVLGKQSLWWGPGTMGGMLYSDNINPVLMFKVNQVQPLVLPSVLKYLGLVRVQAFFGRLAGYHDPRAPYIHGEKIMVKPSPNLDVGFSRTTMAFGQGIPFTLTNLRSTYFSTTDIGGNPNPQDFPGKRFGGLDFSYRLPDLRRWVTVYADNFTADDVNPLVNPSRAFYNPGIFVSQVPHLQKLDFRFEVANTRTRGIPYTSFFYRDGYTNNGFLMGNTVGRRADAFDVSSTYWFSPRKRVEVGWREQRTEKAILPGGGSQDSVRAQADWFIQEQTEFSVFLQHERWAFPFLALSAQSNNVFSLQVTLYPKKLWSRTALRNSD